MIHEKDSLTHYASKYYDPVKAHEYYMRTRELKGRRSSSSLNSEGKKVWAATKNEIATEKKTASENAQNERDKKILELRQKASKTQQAISNRLSDLERALAKRAKAKRESIEDKRAADLERLLSTEVPEGLTGDARAKFLARRDRQIAKLYKDSKSDKAKLSKDVTSEKAANKKDASQQRSKVAAELKSSIAAAREAYKQTKTSLDKSYEDLYQQEYDKILSEYGTKKKSK